MEADSSNRQASLRKISEGYPVDKKHEYPTLFPSHEKSVNTLDGARLLVFSP